MLQIKRLAHIGLLICCLCVLGGCGTWLPVKFAKVEEVFTFAKPIESTGHIPSSSIKKNLFNAPYEDVYRAVSVSISQAQMNVEEEDKSKGIILAVRTIQALPPLYVGNTCDSAGSRGNTRPQPRNYYYAIMVVEKGPKSTEVTAISKAQGRCNNGFCLGDAGAGCDTYSSVHWSTIEENSLPELTQLMTFIRNNLIQAGLL